MNSRTLAAATHVIHSRLFDVVNELPIPYDHTGSSQWITQSSPYILLSIDYTII